MERISIAALLTGQEKKMEDKNISILADFCDYCASKKKTFCDLEKENNFLLSEICETILESDNLFF